MARLAQRSLGEEKMDSPLTYNQGRRKEVSSLRISLFVHCPVFPFGCWFIFSFVLSFFLLPPLCLLLVILVLLLLTFLFLLAVTVVSGEFLNLTKVQRTDSGAYLCIAVSKVLEAGDH